ncbi:MAG: hypothetical protein IJ906_06040 [Oscillospiraceae bacterium]|nr:hypothetical protein [Oscillospiraceae bacterium]
MEQKKKKTIELNACFGDVAQKCERNFVEVLINSQLLFLNSYVIIDYELTGLLSPDGVGGNPNSLEQKERSGAQVCPLIQQTKK